jgi:chemotaxis response regulator CheB
MILVNDNPGIRKSLREWVIAIPEMLIIGETGDGDETFSLAGELTPDVPVLDLESPGMGGDEISQRLTAILKTWFLRWSPLLPVDC